MAIKIPDKYIEQAIARYESERRHQEAAKPPAKGPKRLITISRQAGSGGRQIAEKVGEKLGIIVWGREILDVLAGQSGGDYQARLFEALDERTKGLIETIIGDFFGKIPIQTYHHLLPKAILTIAQNDAVFVGRGVNLLLPEAFRVAVKASTETRIRHLGKYNNMDPRAAEKRIKEADRQSDGFMKELAKTINVKFSKDEYDLGVCTDRISIDDSASIVLHAFDLFQKQHAK
jgi:cytidylate kinase